MSVLSLLRSGDWLNADRLKSYPILFLAVFILASAYWLITSDGYIDNTGKPLGTDFLHYYASSTLVLQGEPAAVYDPTAYAAAEAAVMDSEGFDFIGSHYPPPALMLIAPLALASYGLALSLWVICTLLLNLLVVTRIATDPRFIIPALACPAVIINIGHGQNAFLTCALMGAALLFLSKDKLLAAGIPIGLLIYKPQLGLLIPLALIAAGNWRTFISATITLVLFAGLSWLLLGTETWIGFFNSIETTRTVILEQGSPGWHKFHSWFALARGLNGGLMSAYALQITAVISYAIAVWLLWKSACSFNVKAAGLVIGTLGSALYVLDYDLVLVGLAIIFMTLEGTRKGFAQWEKSLLALLWIWPLIARSFAMLTSLQLTPILLALLMYLIMRRARNELDQQRKIDMG